MSAANDTPVETGRRFVNTWECDENAHMNVQFYVAHFAEAEPHFWLASGLTGKPPAVTARHMRFHREMHASDASIIHSALAAGEDGGALLCHMLRKDDGTLAATCLSALDAGLGEIRAAAPLAPVADAPEAARPHGIAPVAAAPGAADAGALARAGFVPTYRGLVLPRDCDADGTMTAQLYVGRFSDAASHLWHHLGLGTAWRRNNGLGTVAVELRLSIMEPLRAGEPVALLSGLVAHAAKTITFQHQVINVRSGTVAAVGEMTGLAMDLERRRAVAWPAESRAALDEKLCAQPV